MSSICILLCKSRAVYNYKIALEAVALLCRGEKAMLCEMAGQDSGRIKRRKNSISPVSPLVCHWDSLRNSQKRNTVFLTLTETIQ